MTSTTRKDASRKEVRDSIRAFARLMADAPEAPKAPSISLEAFEVPADTMRAWDLIEAL